MSRTFLRSLTAVACAFATLLMLAVPASATVTYPERVEIWRINRDRAAHGIRPLVVSDTLSTAARRHSCQMAAANSLAHSTSLRTIVPSGWHIIGENIGDSWNLWDLHKAFMASAVHRENILRTRFTRVGVGLCRDRSGMYWETAMFWG